MKSTTKRLLVAILSIAMVFTLLPSTVFAAGKPIITQQPASVTAGEDKTVSFTVVAEDATSYRWQVKTSETASWKNSSYNTSTQPTLSIKALASRDGYQYRCKVTNDAGSVYSNAVTLTIKEKPVITQQPVSVTACEGKVVSFTVEEEGAINYRWQLKYPGTDSWINTSYDTSKHQTLSIKALASRDGYQYRCKVTNSYGSVYTNAVSLTVVPAINITTQPRSAAKNVGETAVFSVAAENAESYQWYVKTSKNSAFKVAGFANSKTPRLEVPVTLARNGYEFKCLVKNSGGSKFSKSAVLTVNQAIVIDTQPMSPMAEIGKTVSFSVGASSKIELAYQWQIKISDDAGWKNASSTFTGSKAATIKIPVTAKRNGYQLRCKISNGYTTKYSDAVRLDVYGITKHPQNVTVTENEEVTLSVTAIGDVVGYKWQMRSSSTASWGSVSCTEATYTFTPSLQYNGYQYRCMVIFAYDYETVYSNAATLTVKEDENLPTLTWVTYPQTTVSRTVGERLNIEAQIRGGKAPYTFEWKQTNYNGSETKYYRGESSTGKGKLTKVCEKADFNSMIYLTITDAEGQTISCPLCSNIREFIPIAIRIYPDDLKEVVIDKDDSKTWHFIDTRFSSTGSGRFALEWQYVCTKKSVSQLTDSDWIKVTATSPFSLPSQGNFAVLVSEGDDLYKLMDSGNLYLRCKTTDVERNDVAYTDILPVVYG